MAKRKNLATESQAAPKPPSSEGYTVLARRYRPQQFKDLVGQEPVARALTNALESNRVAHAYLFTGARGVGKTSTARILAKALNCERGPTPTPCDVCDLCRSIASGEDVDVLEIDGASNRGIDEVREIRQNVQYRPGRARYKIYIIDEVHMLTKEAFNALLKTLEEPPAHVKFIFATTEVQRIPVTILSRCQRFDFSGIGAPRIVDRLRQIVVEEGIPADDEALEFLARRAGGSMRDAQSLLDQLLAFGSETPGKGLTTADVHRLLGTANDDRVVALAGAILDGTPKDSLALLREGLDQGLHLGELLDQLLEYWRDLMVVNCAGLEGRDLSIGARHKELLGRQAISLSLDTILAGLDILSATKARLRGSSHGRVLVEMALVRLGRLDDLASLAQISQWLGPSGGARKIDSRGTKTEERKTSTNPIKVGQSQTGARSQATLSRTTSPLDSRPGTPATVLTDTSLALVWREVIAQIGGFLRHDLEKAENVAISGPNTLVLRFSPRYNLEREHCQEPNAVARTEEVLRKITGSPWTLRVESGTEPAAPSAPATETENSPPRSQRQRTEAMQVPLVKRVLDLFGAQIVQMDEGFGAAPGGNGERPEEADSEET